MYQTVSEYPPPLVDRDRFVAVNSQWNANKFTKMWKILSKVCSVFQKWDTGIVKIYWLVTPVSNLRELVNTMKVILDCPGS